MAGAFLFVFIISPRIDHNRWTYEGAVSIDHGIS
ncbi:hypothetical protein SMB34_06870 [Thalassospira permensis NBRC 106175]|uniref:Uncharacterized protein n=1 Tax=Thalassospira permensis NBRC 106175 TaxID=1353532 RepID=A0ABR4TMA7_9PROT|nr:hypothetical protein SMB34_06870 [Thalassospira permensis NBRC 106175]